MKREKRYLVLKNSDMDRCLSEDQKRQLSSICATIDRSRRGIEKEPLKVVVVEHDWPEYEPTWQAIEKRMTQHRPQDNTQ